MQELHYDYCYDFSDNLRILVLFYLRLVQINQFIKGTWFERQKTLENDISLISLAYLLANHIKRHHPH